jgi:cytochrome c-type biogenesis protein CcmH/NrfG
MNGGPATHGASAIRGRTFGADLLLVAATALTYRGSFKNGFVSDDVPGILHNPLLTSLAPDNLARIFTSFDDANYMPLKVLSLAIDQQLFGPAPFGYHLTNLLLHIGGALLVVRILRGADLSPGAALLAALLWALHPLQVESVAFMSERKNVLSGLFFFWAFRRYQRFAAGSGWNGYASILALFVLALLSKMNTVVLPALCVAWDLVVHRQLGRRTLLATAPMLAVGAIVVAINLTDNPAHGAAFHGGSAVATWLTSAMVPFRYLAATLWPAHLRSFYHLPLHGSPLDAPVALALLGLLGLAALTIWLAMRGRREGFWLAWFGITLAPMLNLVPFPTLMQDRYMYLPLVGVLGALATGLDRLRAPAARRAAAGLAGGAALACALLSLQRVTVWYDELSLWRDWAVQEWYLPVDTVARVRDADAKLAFMEEAARATPNAVVVQHNLGALRLERGDLAGALAGLETAQRLGGDSGPLALNLGRAYRRGGDLERADAALRRAVELEPYALYGWLNLARVRLARGDRDGARDALAACARIRPGMQRLWQAESDALENASPH